MKNLRTFLLIGSAFAFAVIGCSKGNAGATGPQGPAGPDSVLHSPWITLNTLPTDAGDTIFGQTLVTPALTASILDSGIILSYFNANGQVFPVSSVSSQVSESFYVDSIVLIANIDLTGAQYRYVLVPGTVTLGTITSGPAQGLTKSELLKMSYNDLEKLLGQPVTPRNN